MGAMQSGCKILQKGLICKYTVYFCLYVINSYEDMYCNCDMRRVLTAAVDCIVKEVPEACSEEDLAQYQGSRYETEIAQYYVIAQYICREHMEG